MRAATRPLAAGGHAVHAGVDLAARRNTEHMAGFPDGGANVPRRTIAAGKQQQIDAGRTHQVGCGAVSAAVVAPAAG